MQYRNIAAPPSFSKTLPFTPQKLSFYRPKPMLLEGKSLGFGRGDGRMGDYKRLIAFKKSECIYDVTCFFVDHYLPKIGDRTVDQMKQAARSGKQNISEGNEAGTTSTEACIKLVNVAKASLKELQEDYEDYLRTHGGTIWNVNSLQCRNARQWCKDHCEPADYRRVCEQRDDLTLANIALILIHQTDYLLKGLIAKYKRDFLTQGGIKEQMSQARRNWREENWRK